MLKILCILAALQKSLSHKPLGHQSTQVKVEEVEGWLEPEEFFNHYVVNGVPLVFKGAAKQFPAYKKWSDEYFLSHPLSETSKISLERGKKETRKGGLEPVPLAEFVRRYKKEDLYCVSGLPTFLREDVPIYHSINCPFILEELLDDLVMWFSSGDTKSVWHYDDYENINCLISGKKVLIMANRTDMNNIHIDVVDGSYSSVDVEAVNEDKYPDFKKIVFYNATMDQGDCIYIPTFWAHTVQSWNRNLALNAWWDLYKSPISCPPVNPNLTWAADLYFRSDSSLGEENEEREVTVLDAVRKLCYTHRNFLIGQRIFEDDFVEIMRTAMEESDSPEEFRDYFKGHGTLLKLYDHFTGTTIKADKDNIWRKIFRELDTNHNQALEATEIDDMRHNEELADLGTEPKDEL